MTSQMYDSTNKVYVTFRDTSSTDYVPYFHSIRGDSGDARVVPRKGDPQYDVADRIQVTINNQVVDATVRAVVKHADGLRLQVDFGKSRRRSFTRGR